MISANSLVFPSPKFVDCLAIQKYLVYIPKGIALKNLHSLPKTTDDLTCAGSPRSPSDQSPQLFFNRKGPKSSRDQITCYGSIPCVYLKGTFRQDKLLIYFHSNAEDIVSAFNFVKEINKSSGQCVLMMQYPGYSIYTSAHFKNSNKYYQGQHEEANAEDIEQDAIKVIQYARQVAGFSLKDITVLGRSIGSGPAMYVASVYAIGSLILLSPFMSLREAVRDLYGQICSKLLKQRFNNMQRARFVECPSLLIHGLADTIIPYSHSIALMKQFKSYSTLKLVENMKHNSFHLHTDFMVHVLAFLKNIQTND